jgi:hypothetical protein
VNANAVNDPASNDALPSWRRSPLGDTSRVASADHPGRSSSRTDSSSAGASAGLKSNGVTIESCTSVEL